MALRTFCMFTMCFSIYSCFPLRLHIQNDQKQCGLRETLNEEDKNIFPIFSNNKICLLLYLLDNMCYIKEPLRNSFAFKE